MTDLTKPVYLDARQVAEKLGLHPKTVYANRTLPRVKIGGSILWIESQIDAFIAMQTHVKPAPRKKIMRRNFRIAEKS